MRSDETKLVVGYRFQHANGSEGPIGSTNMPFRHLTQLHSPDTLEMLFRVLDEAFLLALEERDPLDDPEEDALRQKLGQIILDAYTEGEDDPEMLKRLALVRLARGK
jgi:hypothetical protein